MDEHAKVFLKNEYSKSSGVTRFVIWRILRMDFKSILRLQLEQTNVIQD